MDTPRERQPRTNPDERREHLVRAALRCLVAEGHAGISVRRIAREANVAIGLINHYFGSIDALVAQAYETLASEVNQSLRACLEAAGEDPEARLDAFLNAYFSPVALNPDLLSPWVVFWSLIRHSPQVNEAHERTYGGTLRMLEGLLSDLSRKEGFAIAKPRLAAIGFSAMLDGLWLEWCLNPANISAEDGLEISRRWIASLRAGAYA
ncbi:TetR/AcrR family transcriptional regulator [Metapseudomonas furukawaii]|uniref:Transcriptional regulator n=1 Tax=Metapseudomonas furukawaii TaxID=1149133 RepID=A0AAD1BY39_METFU|nr:MULTISPECIES: TetR family transcriptional regulator C-terminal domain-containing protein [Pseudomonas]ELS26735.1 Transcriptional regulator, TetR family [Pseudomonas furukawaii]OWJ94144.1 TetR family transcriptional regulator [Pseudomonas sp. A46]WAG79976.1 TetR family transcriptional regulator C-terminal domain-containing protein [Pseudomonas furukawaii]BAU72592.1 transcriptional regulator [Pseudomonas furukawaii]